VAEIGDIGGSRLGGAGRWGSLSGLGGKGTFLTSREFLARSPNDVEPINLFQCVGDRRDMNTQVSWVGYKECP